MLPSIAVHVIEGQRTNANQAKQQALRKGWDSSVHSPSRQSLQLCANEPTCASFVEGGCLLGGGGERLGQLGHEGRGGVTLLWRPNAYDDGLYRAMRKAGESAVMVQQSRVALTQIGVRGHVEGGTSRIGNEVCCIAISGIFFSAKTHVGLLLIPKPAAGCSAVAWPG
jgi:hypothetical protein